MFSELNKNFRHIFSLAFIFQKSRSEKERFRKRKRESNQNRQCPLPPQSDFCHVMLTLVTEENASEAQDLLAKKTFLLLNQWIAPRLSLICVCVVVWVSKACSSYKDWILLVGLMMCIGFPLFIMKTLTCFCHKHKRTYLIQPVLNPAPINFGWVLWIEQKWRVKQMLGLSWIEALSHWMTLWKVSWPLCLSAIQQYHWGKGGTTLNAGCCAHAFQAKLQTSKTSMLIQKHFLNDFLLKGWEWPGSQWETGMISFVLAGWAPVSAEHPSGIAKIPTALKKIWQCQCWQDRKYRQKHLCACSAQLYTGCYRSFHGVHARLMPSWVDLGGKEGKLRKMQRGWHQWKANTSDIFPHALL